MLEIVAGAHTHWASIAKLIPKGEFFRYQWALSPMFKSLVSSIAMARFILHDELVPAFTAANLMGREFLSAWRSLTRLTFSAGRGCR